MIGGVLPFVGVGRWPGGRHVFKVGFFGSWVVDYDVADRNGKGFSVVVLG